MKANTQPSASEVRVGQYNRITSVPAQAGGTMRGSRPVLDGPVQKEERGTRSHLFFRMAVSVGGLLILVLGWWALAVLGNYPAYILPTPLAVGQRTWGMLLDGSLGNNFLTTVIEAGLGFLLALALGLTLGYSIAHSRLLERVISPYIAISQGLPVVALAPLLVIWIQDDLARHVVIVALIVFFPVLVNTIVGLRSIERSMLEVARISGANLWQTIIFVELPLSMRALLAGVKLGLTLSITGAVVSEFVSSGSGLGFLLILGRGQFDTTLVFVGLIALALLTTLSYMGVSLLEKAILTWDDGVMRTE